MSIQYIRELPTVEEILQAQPLPDEFAVVKKKKDAEIADVLTGRDKKLLVLIGPCSAHQEDAVCEYVSRLSRVQEKVGDSLVLVPRIYTNKPRTTGRGYKGMLHQPDHQKNPDIALGLKSIRQMHLRAISESGLPAADEMLYPGNYTYLADLLSYVAIGARSVENQQHRLTVSGLDIPAGMKNPTSGDLRVMLDSVYAAHHGHVFVYNGWEVSTSGNTLAHSVVRGTVDQYGNHIPNYHYEDLTRLAAMYIERNLENPAIIVDTNHSNSAKQYREQPRIVMEVMRSRRHSPALKEMVKGFMIESYILEGAQDPAGNEYGRSITDPCLGWEQSERLLYDLAEIACK